MAGYNDSEGPYVSGAAGVFTHLAHMTDITNKFDKDDVPATGYVWIYNSTNGVYRSRALLSTDMPTIVRSTKTSTPYTLVLADAGSEVEMNLAGANSVIVPLNSSVAFPIGTQVGVRQYGAGLTSIAPFSGGVLIRSRGGLLNSAGQYAPLTLTKRATDEWFLDGDLA